MFGAGTGLGLSVARRFGREGFRVALVARRPERLEGLVRELTKESIEAASFSADLNKPDEMPGVVEAIRERFGRIDVVEYGPNGGNQGFTAAKDLDDKVLAEFAPLFLFTPVEVVRSVLPEMLERGDGAILFTHGYSAVQPMPFLSGPGPLMSAARNYLYSLNAELKDTGVYAGTLAIAASIDRSEAAAAYLSSGDASSVESTLPAIDPDVLAEYYWDMYTRRDRVEQVHPPHLSR
ncbi:SDR family NAD(P)-dependent oxidoreductase [Rhodococcus ruber]|uniref:SDR family NAD(P)-dependent oxidoreductase n=1 Tax=Rhodococcus ruber TaxID=1830 RepID=A0ABT4MET1_9NOCA|nr:SDR family NAD(P)-dependent oxidoreductase [Rhodococcus ruber]MCZ4519491.1 SDR family NAD(P)-dependent oxidoreductase [Rhodococcus ruber]